MGLVLSVVGSPAHAAPEALIGILQGQAVLVRESTRYALVEGAALSAGDIVETAKGAFMQIEFTDGVLVGVGEASRLILRPRLTPSRKAVSPRLYQLEGWTKLRLPAAPQVEFGLWTPSLELDGKSGSAVVRVQGSSWAVFAETGSVRVLQRDGAKDTLALRRGEFVSWREGGGKPVKSAQLSSDFVQQLPRDFRDALPARSELYAKRNVPLQSLGPVSYEDVSAWLHTEPKIRLALSRQWRGRAADRDFRSAAAANLSAHMEWERVLFPERFLPKKPPPPASAVLPASASLN